MTANRTMMVSKKSRWLTHCFGRRFCSLAKAGHSNEPHSLAKGISMSILNYWLSILFTLFSGYAIAGDIGLSSLAQQGKHIEACETARGKIANGGDVVRFTRDFLYAGSRSIVASL
jgi:hypothetical protein